MADLHHCQPAVAGWSSYLALGDSFTEGLWDIAPTADIHANPAVRGWADRLATLMSARRCRSGQAPLQYANLAVRGLLLGPIIDTQVPVALDLKPDLVSLIGGGNDTLRPTMDPDKLALALEEAVVQLRAHKIDVLLGTGADVKGSPVIAALRPRVAILNTHIHSIARRHGAYVLDLWGQRALRDWRMWSADRIHLTPAGHERVANAALVALGLPPDDPAWATPLPAAPAKSWRQRLQWNLQWGREWAGPWLARRLRGISSATNRHPKRPELGPVTATSTSEPGSS